MLEQAFNDTMRKSKLFQAHRKVLRNFLDAMKLEMLTSAGQENSEEDLLKSFEELTTYSLIVGVICALFYIIIFFESESCRGSQCAIKKHSGQIT